MGEFVMPSLGADMSEGTVIRWLVKPGDPVNKGDIVVEVETDKADMEVEIFEGGVIERLLVPEGERVAVGTPLATVVAPEARRAPAAGPPAEAPPPVAAAAPSSPSPRVTPTARALALAAGVDLSRVEGSGVGGAITRADVARLARESATARDSAPMPVKPGGRPPVSPRARRLAAAKGIDPSAVAGTGPGRSVTGEDIEAAASAPAVAVPAPPPAQPAVATGTAQSRGPIAALMSRANREIPHYFLGADIDLSRALEWLRAENRRRPVTDRMLASALLLKAAALAAHEVPEMNGLFREDRFEPSGAVNLGVAISLRGGGLVAPAILDAANKPADVVMKELADLVDRARKGKLRASEMSAGTITVTNLGDQGVDFVYGVIYPPQVALVGFGRVQERAWAQDGMVGARPVVTATLAADHRVSDGHRGGIFLTRVERLLQEPEHL